MRKQEIEQLLQAVDGSGSEEEWLSLRELKNLGECVAQYLPAQILTKQSAKARALLVNLAVAYARENTHAYQVGLQALQDTDAKVQFYACKLLAYAQQPEALFQLKTARDHSHGATLGHIQAAMDALLQHNPHYFIDHHHTGCIFLLV